MPSQDLVFRFLGVDAGASREFDRMAGKSASLHKAIGALGVATAAVGIGVESVKAAAKFQTAMELIHTQAGKSQAEVTRMSKAVLGLAGPAATAPEEVATYTWTVVPGKGPIGWGDIGLGDAVNLNIGGTTVLHSLGHVRVVKVEVLPPLDGGPELVTYTANVPLDQLGT